MPQLWLALDCSYFSRWAFHQNCWQLVRDTYSALGFPAFQYGPSLGWLPRIIGVAETHRWRHKRDFEDAQVNFGEFLLVWDLFFKTFYDSRKCQVIW
jgi:hypothetical protein